MVSLNNIPADILMIIQGYTDQLKHTTKMAAALNNITEMEYKTEKYVDGEENSYRINQYGDHIKYTTMYGSLTIVMDDYEMLEIREYFPKVEVIDLE